MKKLLILLASLVLLAAPIMSMTQNKASGTADEAIAAVLSPAPVSNAAAPIPAVILVIVLAAVYALRRGIRRKIRSLWLVPATDSDKTDSALAILELIQILLGIIFPAVTAILLVLHLSGVIPYVSVAEEIAGILLSAGIAVCEILDAFLKKKKTIKTG